MGGDGFPLSLEGKLITEGYLARHYRGRSGGRDYALLDVAQDYALKLLSNAGTFELGLVFKGGTALRKYRAGNLGRFSTDLDFACTDPDLGKLVLEVLHGANLFDVRFEAVEVTPGRRGRLLVSTPLGNPGVDAMLEISPRASWLRPEIKSPLHFPVHGGYEFTPASVPVMAFEETLAEKLAAFRRRSLIRDLYDLDWFAHGGAFNEELVRKLTYLKVYVDVVEDGLGREPFDPRSDLFDKSERDFPPEDIGLLEGTIRIEEWLESVRARFDFLNQPSGNEEMWARCERRERYAVSEAIAQLAKVDTE